MDSTVKEIEVRSERWRDQTGWYVSLLLGQASALLGLMIMLGWMLAFVLVVPQKAVGWAAGPRLMLPFEPPLIGLMLGALGLAAARLTHQPIARFSIAGLVFNAIPLALAVALILARTFS